MRRAVPTSQLEGPIKRMKTHPPLLPFFASLLVCLAAAQLAAQDWVHTGTNLGNDRIRIAAADFKPGAPGDRSSSPGWKPVGGDPQTPALKATFDATLYSDLANAGIFDLVSKSLAPQSTPGSPQEINLSEWSAAPANAASDVLAQAKFISGKAGGNGAVRELIEALLAARGLHAQEIFSRP